MIINVSRSNKRNTKIKEVNIQINYVMCIVKFYLDKAIWMAYTRHRASMVATIDWLYDER